MVPTQEAQMEHIKKNIAILEGKAQAITLRRQVPGSAAGAPAATAAPAQTATGPNGHQIVVRNGQWVDAQTGAPVK